MEKKDLEVHDESGGSKVNSKELTDGAVKKDEVNKTKPEDSKVAVEDKPKSGSGKSAVEDKPKPENSKAGTGDKAKSENSQGVAADKAKPEGSKAGTGDKAKSENSQGVVADKSKPEGSKAATADKAKSEVSKKEEIKPESKKAEEAKKEEVKSEDKKEPESKKVEESAGEKEEKKAKPESDKKDEKQKAELDKKADGKEKSIEETKVSEKASDINKKDDVEEVKEVQVQKEAVDKPEDSESASIVSEESKKSRKRKSKIKRRYIASILGIGLAVVYFGGVYYFQKRFLPNTTINYTDASFATIDDLDAKLQIPLNNYSLEIIAREGERHFIRARDIDLHYKLDKSIDSVLANQEVYKWPIYLFKKNPHKVEVTVDLDNSKLEYILSNYDCLTEAKFKEARDAYIASYSNADGYVIEKEYDGTRIDIDKAKEKIKSSLIKLGLSEDLDADNLYGFAKIKEDDAKLLSAQDILNKHASTVINYAGGAVLNGERISQWIGVDDEGNLILDESGIRAFVDELAERYDTLGKPRIFKTTDAREVEVAAKKYGWQVDKEGEFQAIKASILAGEQLDREPVFASRAASLEGNDFGNTYVEIDLGNQKLYYYVEGQLALSSDIVSGALWGGRKTPPGLYKVNYKARNVVLRGPNYAAPVRYWMPFNGGIGMHDANWRSSFGGGIYKSSGSHGCINMPSSSAKALYDIINKDCPVICYY